MKTSILFLLFMYLFSYNSLYANWYQNHGEAYVGETNYYWNSGWEIDNCVPDTDSAWPAAPWGYAARAALNNTSTASNVTPHGTTVNNVSQNGTARCLYWDAATPIATSISYLDDWANAANTLQTVSFSFTDTGWSGLRRYQIEYRTATDNPTFIAWGWWGNTFTWNISWTPDAISLTRDYTVVNNRAYQFRVRTQDEAAYRNGATLWSAWLEGTDTITVDTVAPTFADLNPLTPEDLLAVTSQNFQVQSWTNGWSPIVSIRWRFGSNALTTIVWSTWSWNGNISVVDPASGTTVVNVSKQWSRQYYVNITRIEDDAWNIGNITPWSTCWSGGTPTGHLCFYSFANTQTAINSSSPNFSTELWSLLNIADGSVINTTVRLEDQFWNDIVYAPDIGRTINFEVTADNNIFLNQYNQSWWSALYFGTSITSVPIWTGTSQSYNNRQSTSRDYTLPFYIFAPTNSADPFVPWTALVSSVSFDVNWTLGWRTWVGPVVWWAGNISASPLFTTNFSWEIVTQWFIEWSNQVSSINVSKTNWTVTSAESLRMEFGEVASPTSNVPNTQYRMIMDGSTLSQGTLPLTASVPTVINSSFTNPLTTQGLNSQMIQYAVVPSIRNSYLASIVQYTNNGRVVTYPYDILWKTSYYNGTAVNNSTQAGIKILWNTSSQNSEWLTVSQFSDDVRIIGRLTKSTFRRDIEQKVNSVIRNVSAKTTWSTTVLSTHLGSQLWDNAIFNTSWASRWESIFGESVVYFGNMWNNYIEISWSNNIEWWKTIIVEDGDVYITGNIRNNDNDGAMLWIIALGWNIYIRPDVTDVQAVLYTNRAVMSATDSDSSWDIASSEQHDGTTNANILENQLYIKGSIFSENTIWGARWTLQCPYYINTNCTTFLDDTHRNNAQKYDLNFIRRYYFYDSDGNGTPDTPSGVQSLGALAYQEFPLIIEYNPQIQQNPPPFFD